MDELKQAKEAIRRWALVTAYLTYGMFLRDHRGATDVPYLDESNKQTLLDMDLRLLESLVSDLQVRIVKSRLTSE